jgi:hypothetical protein
MREFPSTTRLCHHRQVAFSASRDSLFVRDYAIEGVDLSCVRFVDSPPGQGSQLSFSCENKALTLAYTLPTWGYIEIPRCIDVDADPAAREALGLDETGNRKR